MNSPEPDIYHEIYPEVDPGTGLYPYQRPVEPAIDIEDLNIEEIQRLKDEHYKKLLGACPVLRGHF